MGTVFYFVGPKTWSLRLFDYQKMTTVHSFTVKSPDGLTTSKMVVRMLGDKVRIDLDAERDGFHKKASFNRSEAEYGASHLRLTNPLYLESSSPLRILESGAKRPRFARFSESKAWTLCLRQF